MICWLPNAILRMADGFTPFIGSWRHVASWDSDDYLALYVISGTADAPVVHAKDLSDDEVFVISDIRYQNGTLTFTSLMPSTQRRGINRLRLCADGSMEVQFTFTVLERLERFAQ